MKDSEINELLKNTSKSSDIAAKLNITDRKWRRMVEEYNSQYDTRERLIVSSKDGYEVTTNKKLIKAYAFRRIHHALAELKNAKKILKSLKDKDQLKLTDEEIELADVVMKMKV